MTCKHCHISHPPVHHEWPESWDEVRRHNFTHAMVALNVGKDYISTMAAEIERMKTSSPYVVSEHELIQYLSQSHIIAGRLAGIEDRRQRLLGWSWKLGDRFNPTIDDNSAIGFLKLGVLVLLGGPLFFVTVPIRLPLAIWRWRVASDFHPHFTDWLKVHGVKK